MKKSIITTATLAALALAGTASATQSRIESVGGGVKNITFLDDRNIFVLPAELVKYGTWAAIETGAAGFSSFGFHYNFSPTVVLAIYGTTQTFPSLTIGDANSGGAVSQFGGADVNSFPNAGNAGGTHKGTAILGVDLGTARLGFLLGAWADTVKDTTPVDQDVTKLEGPLRIQFAAGFGFGTGIGDVDMALSLGLGLPTEEGPDGAIIEGKQIDIGFVFRGTFPFSGPHELVPFATLDIGFADSAATEGNATTHDGIRFGMDVGMDIRLNLADGITVQPGIGFGGSLVKHNQTPDGGDTITNNQSKFFFPFYSLAVDVQVWEWLDIRFGGEQRVYWEWTDGTDGEGDPTAGHTEAKVDHKITTGVGINLPAGVSIDIQVNTGWWQNGPDIITGAGAAGGFGLNAAISKDW